MVHRYLALSALIGGSLLLEVARFKEQPPSIAYHESLLLPEGDAPLPKRERTVIAPKKSPAASLPTFDVLQTSKVKNPVPTGDLVDALRHNLQLLRNQHKGNTYQVNETTVTTRELIQTTETLLQWAESNGKDKLNERFEGHPITGRGGKSNVKFTAYYTPEILASYTESEEFPVPIYHNGNTASVLGWVASRTVISNIRLQGSGVIRFPDGNQALIAYAGNNRYSSKAVLVANTNADSTNSFRLLSKPTKHIQPKGSGGIVLTPNVSIAVDTRHLPLGSALLAAVPVLDSKGNLIRHDYNILLAQDSGGAIKGMNHIDYYTGIGEEAHRKARFLKHQGKLWLLVLKENDVVLQEL